MIKKIKILSLFLTLSFGILYPLNANAAGFSATRIIDDIVFTNKSAMSEADVQNFLNSKNSVCLKNYQTPEPLGNNTYGANVSAARAIWKAGQLYNINPQVLLVTLQKEQGFITRTDCPDWRYKTAMGFGCPDTAPCDEQWFGLSKQLYQAARHYRGYFDVTPGWYVPYTVGSRFVRWSPITSCGGATINIENRATASLYNYTPYQPNQAALNAGWGLGDSCSAYGNRNFWLYFNAWFGSTYSFYSSRPSYESSYAKAACSIRSLSSFDVARLYNPDTNDYLFTNSQVESCLAVKYGYIWDGVVFSSVDKNIYADASPVFRLSGSSRHLYTTSESVRDDYINNKGYKYEGISFYVFTAPRNDIPLIEVQCLYSDSSVTYTSSEGEFYHLKQSGYSAAGVAFLVPKNNTAGAASRFVDSMNKRIYTSSVQEKSSLPSFGFRKESDDFNVDSQGMTGNSPIFRLRSNDGSYLFTSSFRERNLAVIDYGYYSEGTAFFVPGNSTLGQVPIYRLVDKYQNRLYTKSLVEKNMAESLYGYHDEGIAWHGYNVN